MADRIPDDVGDFILRYIDSIAQLEALLLLRANSTERWETTNMATRLYAAERDVEAVLARLCADELISSGDGAYRYDPRPEEKRAVIDRLATIYAQQLIPVTNMIHAKERRIRDFADAFRFRKDR